MDSVVTASSAIRVVIRVDSSRAIGTGHVMRCLTLADELRGRGAEVLFICREHPGNLIDLIAAKGYAVVRLAGPAGDYARQNRDVAHASWLGVSWEADADDTIAVMGERRVDWLVVDHYALDLRWEKMLRPYVGKIMVIDDLADRPHDCDMLLDQNLYHDMEQRYDGLVSKRCHKLIGPCYALLRPEFRIARERQRERNGVVRRILVFFGGSDPTNETAKAMQALRMLDRPDILIDVVVGASNPNRGNIEEFCREFSSFTYHCQIENMSELMATADLAIGGGGTTTWERCVLGVPSLTVILAANQAETSRAIAAAGATCLAGSIADTTLDTLVNTLHGLITDQPRLVEIAKQARGITGTREVWNPVADAMLEPLYAEA